MEKNCDDCEKIVRLTEDGKDADNIPTDEELIKDRDDACEAIINAEIIKKLKGLANDLV